MEQKEVQEQLQTRFKTLPKVVQDSITSANVEKHLRELADTHKLHFDQWTTLENEVMITLLGLEPIDALAQNIEHQVGVSAETARALAEDISTVVFAPIRTELEHLLVQPSAAAQPPVVPGTPPSPSPHGQAIRAPVSETYTVGQASRERKTIEGDPYREPVV